MLSSWNAVAVAVAMLLGPSPGELLLDYDARTAYVARWSPTHLRVRFRPPAGPLADRSMQPTLETSAALVLGTRGPEVLAAAGVLAGVEWVEVLRRDGQISAARVVAPSQPDDAAAVRIVLDRPRVLDGLPVLTWAPDEGVVEHARGWILEDSGTRGPDGELAAPVLVDTVLGGQVEYPLERFRVVPVRFAAGHPVLDHEGRVLCFLFRTSGDGSSSLCAPRDSLLGAPQRQETPAEQMQLLRP